MNPQQPYNQPPQDPYQPEPQPQNQPQMFNQPFVTPQGAMPPVIPEAIKPVTGASVATKSKLPLILGGLAGVQLIVIIGLALVLVLSSGGSTPAATTETASDTTDVTAATSTSVQLTSNSMSDDISSLNSDQNYPASRFTDKSLGL